ncbi:MAG: Flp family type IVb pilin [Solirubrobacterales bacterium]
MQHRIIKFYTDEQGQGMVEYGLILVFVALVVIAALTIFGQNVANSYNNLNNKVP